MRNLVEVKSGLRTWFQDPDNKNEIRSNLFGLGRESVLAMTQDFYEEAANPGPGCEERRYLQAEVFRNCISHVGTLRPGTIAEFKLGDGVKLPALRGSEEYQSKVREHEVQPQPGEEVTKVFDRMFKHLLPVTDHLIFIDQYLYKKWGEENSGASVFLGWLIDSGVSKITMLTLQSTTFHERDLNEIHANIQRLVNRGAKDLVLELQIYGHNHPLPHDRLGEFKFRWGSLPFAIGYGAQLFESKTLSYVATVTAAPLREEIQDIRELLRSTSSKLMVFKPST